MRGSCLCGGVTFEIDRVVGPTEFCHCNRCRKISGSNALLTIRVHVNDYRLLTGGELIRSYAAPVLYRPPPYRSTFCSVCGSPVPDPVPGDDSLEIPVGTLDGDAGIRPDKHIFVDLMPAWDQLRDGLPAYTRAELYKLRTGNDLPPGSTTRLHASKQSRPDESS
jgi:hypothetical protein